MQQARDEGLGSEARQILRVNGVTITPGPVSSTINKVPLRVSEQTKYQQLANKYIDQAIHDVAQREDFKATTQAGKERMLNNVISDARNRAGTEVLRMLPESVLRQRIAAGSSAP
jgi:phage terminase Nu1 subunit (DNA packaging protein)